MHTHPYMHTHYTGRRALYSTIYISIPSTQAAEHIIYSTIYIYICAHTTQAAEHAMGLNERERSDEGLHGVEEDAMPSPSSGAAAAAAAVPSREEDDVEVYVHTHAHTHIYTESEGERKCNAWFLKAYQSGLLICVCVCTEACFLKAYQSGLLIYVLCSMLEEEQHALRDRPPLRCDCGGIPILQSGMDVYMSVSVYV